jgi:hypothetical protein
MLLTDTQTIYGIGFSFQKNTNNSFSSMTINDSMWTTVILRRRGIAACY